MTIKYYLNYQYCRLKKITTLKLNCYMTVAQYIILVIYICHIHYFNISYNI